MKQKYNRAKLRLRRETLYALQHDDLDAINGGVANTGCLSQCTQCGGGPKWPQPHPDPLGGDNVDPIFGGGRPGHPFPRI